MASTTTAPPSRQLIDSVDQRVVLHGVSYADYERLLAIRGEAAGPRMTYLAGELELMSPSRSHEGIKTCIARLLEAYAFERGIDLSGFGSWTLKCAARERGIEPDECYILGEPGTRETPDLAIEVDWTTSSIDKLEVYRGLEIKEVWRWRDGRIEVHRLGAAGYERAERSGVIPELDLDLLARHVADSQSRAVRDYLAALRAGR